MSVDLQRLEEDLNRRAEIAWSNLNIMQRITYTQRMEKAALWAEVKTPEDNSPEYSKIPIIESES